MIIVEGSDHVGKTTFCHKLVDELKRQGFNPTYRHMSKPGDNFDYFGDYMSRLYPGHVYDRLHYGAYVYGAMLNLHPTKGFSLESMQLVSRFIHLRGGLIVLMHDSDLEEYARRLTLEAKEEMFRVRDIEFANRLFAQMHLVDNPDIVLDVRGGTRWPEEHVKVVVSEWRRRNGL